MKKRLLVCSDIHGQYDQFIELLKKADYDPEQDQLILLGDYIDRGPKSREVIAKVIELVDGGAIALRGNHDEMMIEFADKYDPNSFREQLHERLWMDNGGGATLRSYIGDHDLLMEHAEWMKDNLKLYHETGEYIFVHAGVAPHIPMDKQRAADMIWIRHNWPCGLGKTIVHGHTPVKDVTFVHDQIFVDTGSVYGNKLTMLVLPSGETFAA